MENEKKSFFFQPEEKKKWWQFRKMDKKEYGYVAIVGILGGVIIKGALGDVLSTAGLVSGFVWLFLTIKQKVKK